ncbi:SPOR domain-containing protein [Neisseria musculi]|uniref:Sporulation related domain protein n=1 Tax=Neisseria musculi TaxID=1815583 RepID=A0A7H1MEW1_9NEIS|nr:SPOR domain-containing protein [Neisseria musculi]QNT60176.1 sporulation related domain protein [Neisseria musculi]
MNAKKQYGKGLSGFMLGLLLATAVIAGVLFFLNKSNKEAFKEETRKDLPQPEILTPNSSGSAASAPPPAPPADTASDVSDGPTEEQQAVSEPITGTAPEPAASDTPTAPPPQTTVKPKPEQKPIVKKPEAKKEQPAKTKEEPKQEERKKAAQPTPEQILNSGSIEKARENARAEAAKKEMPAQESTKKADSGKQQPAGDGGGRTVLQMGSFNNRESAEAHRAKLAMMGISSGVVEGEANGKTVYRVQSGRMGSDAAHRVQQTLKRNGIDSFARSVK